MCTNHSKAYRFYRPWDHELMFPEVINQVRINHIFIHFHTTWLSFCNQRSRTMLVSKERGIVKILLAFPFSPYTSTLVLCWRLCRWFIFQDLVKLSWRIDSVHSSVVLWTVHVAIRHCVCGYFETLRLAFLAACIFLYFDRRGRSQVQLNVERDAFRWPKC